MQRGRVLFVVLVTVLLAAFAGDHSPKPYKFPDLKFFPVMPVSASNPVTAEGAELGRYLFYDPVLSRDSNMSCASCHKQEFAFSDEPKKFSTGRNGELMTRNTMPLFNLAWYTGFFWDGKANTLEEQPFFPVRAHNEMDLSWPELEKRLQRSKLYSQKFNEAFGRQKIDSVHISKALAQFLRTLISAGSRYDKVLALQATFTKEEYEGFVLANDQRKGDCLHCHTTDANALGTTGLFSNNGLDPVVKVEDYKDMGRGGVTGKPTDIGKFKIPSLRNLMLTAPYMHDGRFRTLEEVLDFYSEGVHPSVNIDSKMEFADQKGVKLTAQEKMHIISFLKTLTDSAFVSDPAFGSPFR